MKARLMLLLQYCFLHFHAESHVKSTISKMDGLRFYVLFPVFQSYQDDR